MSPSDLSQLDVEIVQHSFDLLQLVEPMLGDTGQGCDILFHQTPDAAVGLGHLQLVLVVRDEIRYAADVGHYTAIPHHQSSSWSSASS